MVPVCLNQDLKEYGTIVSLMDQKTWHQIVGNIGIVTRILRLKAIKSIGVIEYTFLPWRTQGFWAGFWSEKKRRLVFDPRKRDILTAFVTLSGGFVTFSGGSAGQKNIQCGAAIGHHLVVMYKSILPMELLSNFKAYGIFHFDMNHFLNRWNRNKRRWWGSFEHFWGSLRRLECVNLWTLQSEVNQYHFRGQ